MSSNPSLTASSPRRLLPRPTDAAACGDGIAQQLGALCGRPARILDLAALAPGHDRAIEAVEPDAYDLILGVRLEALVDARGAEATRNSLGELARKAGACLIEHGSTDQAPLRDIFAFVHALTPHEARRLGADWPACFASNRYWYLGGRLGVFDRVLTEPHAAARGAHDDTRRYYLGGGVVVKVHRYDHAAWGAINRAALNREVAFLRNPPPGVPAPPLVLWGETLHEGWLARGCLDGDLLLDLVNAGRPYEATTVVRDVLGQLAALERSGLYHEDVRIWNVIVGADGHASLIDYGSIIETPIDCAWPDNVFLSFLIFAREVHGRVTGPWPDIRRPWLNPDGLPEARAFWAMLESPPETWSFARLQRGLNHAPTTPASSGVRATIAALERFEVASEVLRRRETARADGPGEREARHADTVQRLERELAETRLRLADAERALQAATGRAAAHDVVDRPRSWRTSAPLRVARQWRDALTRGLKAP